MDVTLLEPWFVALLPWLAVFAVVMLLDFMGGAVLAWYNGVFSWETAPRFFQTGLLYLWAWLTAEILGFLPLLLGVEIAGWGDALADYGPEAVFVAIVVGKYVASIVGNIKQIQELRALIAAHDAEG